MVLHDSSRI
uniref:Uncharacterized protein n=1 Tax=Arundo donax TaxID=35708 RepID=A0A0A8Y3A5_ARUDO